MNFRQSNIEFSSVNLEPVNKYPAEILEMIKDSEETL